MSKKRWFQKQWISVDKRLPERDRNVICWNPNIKRAHGLNSSVFVMQQNQLRENIVTRKELEENPLSYDLGYWATHWMYCYPPEE